MWCWETWHFLFLSRILGLVLFLPTFSLLWQCPLVHCVCHMFSTPAHICTGRARQTSPIDGGGCQRFEALTSCCLEPLMATVQSEDPSLNHFLPLLYGYLELLWIFFFPDWSGSFAAWTPLNGIDSLIRALLDLCMDNGTWFPFLVPSFCRASLLPQSLSLGGTLKWGNWTEGQVVIWPGKGPWGWVGSLDSWGLVGAQHWLTLTTSAEPWVPWGCPA